MSDWELFFKRTNYYVPLHAIEKRYNASIDFSILHWPESISKIDGSKDIIILNVKEQYSITDSIGLLEKQCQRPIEDIILLSDTVWPNTLFYYDNPNFFFAYTWFDCPVGVCEQVVEPKRYLFDFLVGYKRKQCDRLFQVFEQKGLLRNSLYKYDDMGNFDFDDMGEQFSISWEKQGVESTIDMNTWASKFGTDSLNNHNAWPSRIVPKKAYEQTLFSVVRESQFYFDTHLFYQPSEKTAKPILCKRLFFTLGAKGVNENYVKLGFRPYDYDNNTWDQLDKWQDRVDAFADYISKLDQTYILELYEKEKDNIQHNYKLATRPWAQQCLNFVLDRLASKYS